MARLILRCLAVAALLLGGTAAVAEPITGVVLFTIGTVSVTVGTALFVLSVASSIYGAVQTKKKARAAAQRAAEIEAASLKDRTTTLLTADSPPAVIYGQPAPVGGAIAAVLTSGDADQFKHVVLILAAHECTAVDEIFIGGESIGALDAGGYAGSPSFALDDGVPRVESRPFELLAVPEGGENTGLTPDGYAALPMGPEASGFSLVSVRDERGVPYGAGFEIVTTSPLGFGARALKGPIGAKGTVTYRIDGAGPALNVQIHLSPGGVDTADAFLRAARPDLWTADHKLSGYTYLVVTMNLLLERFQGGVPEITARVRGKKVFDHRTGQTVYSRNPALCLADFIRSEAGYGASAAQIDLDAVVAAANACDVAVYDPSVVDIDPATFGFSTARYTCDGMFRTDQDRDRTRQQIEDAMVGFSLESGGVWRIQAGAWSTPVLSLTDDDMVMPIGIVQTCNVGTSRYNGAKGTYVNATRLGVTEDFAPYVNPVFRAQDVKDKFLDLTLSFIGNYIRCRQAARVLVEQSRGGFVVQVFPKMFAWHLQPGDRLVLSSVLYAFTNKTFRVQDWTYRAGAPVALQCVEDEEAFYDQTDETRADAAPNTQLPSPFLKPAPPLDLAVQSGEAHMVAQDGVMVVRARVSWQQSPDPAVRRSGIVRVQWRPVVGEAEWQSADLPGDATLTYLLALAVNTMYVVRAQFQTAYASSAWSVAEHMLVGVEGPPSNVMGFDVRVEAGGVVASWREPVGIDLTGWSATQLRRGPTWALAEAATLFDGRATRADLGWFPAGLWSVWAAHRSTAGRWSTPVMDLLEILAPSQPVVTGEAWRDRVELAWPECTTTQPLRGYEIRVGDIFASAPVVDVVNALGWVRTESEPGKRLYWVTAVDVAGNRGAPGYKEIETLPGIDEALAELQAGLDKQIDELLAVAGRGGFIRANLLYNGGFERGKDGWTTTAPAGFELGTRDWGTQALVTAPPAAGRLEGKAVESITPGKTYCVSADMAFVSPTGSAVLSLEFRNAAGAVLATFRGAALADRDFSNDPDRRASLAVEGIAPAGATRAVAGMAWTGYTATGAGKVGLRYAKVELGGLPSTVYTAETTDRYIGAAVAQVIQVANDAAARLAASYTLAVSAGKRVAGLRAMADDTTSALVFLAESIAFAIGDQDEAKQLMTLGTVNGTPSVGIAGNMYLDGVLKTRMLDAEAVTADKIRAKAITAAQIAAGAITADLIDVGVGANLVPNATLAERPGERGVPSNWTVSHNIDEGVSFGTQFGGNYQLLDGVTGFIQQVNNRYAGWGFYDRNAQMHSPVFPVEPGTRYEYHARLVAHRCQATVLILFMDFQGNWLKTEAPAPAAQPGGNALALADYAKYGGFSTSPANAARARLLLIKGATSPGAGDSYLFWTQPFVAVATPSQTVFSPYTPSGLGTKITPSGITTPNLSSLSATIGWLETATAGGRVQVRDNVVKVFDENNVLRVQLGNLDL